MLNLAGKSSVDQCCTKEKAGGFWDVNFYSSDIKDHGIALLILVLCLYNISKLASPQKIWRKTKGWIPNWMYGSHIDRRIDALTSDLRTEMRELSEQIIEFQKWSNTNFQEPGGTSGTTHKQRNSCKMPGGATTFLKGNTYIPTEIDNEISECNWLQYLHKYVYNPSPRILDTSQLENIKRAYSNWF